MVRVAHTQRPVPLSYLYADSPLHDTVQKLVRNGKAPLYVVHFTQRAAGETAGALMSVDLTSKEDKKAIREAIRGFWFDSPYGPDLLRFLSHGASPLNPAARSR